MPGPVASTVGHLAAAPATMTGHYWPYFTAAHGISSLLQRPGLGQLAAKAGQYPAAVGGTTANIGGPVANLGWQILQNQLGLGNAPNQSP